MKVSRKLLVIIIQHLVLDTNH